MSEITDKRLGQRYSLLTREYIRDCIRLAASFIIKLDVVARYEEFIVRNTNPDVPPTLNKSDWKYYQHISGQYHYTDKPIIIRSSDTHTEETLTIELLKTHTRTAKVLRKKSVEYQNLIDVYPDSITLISGILYPSDITEAISAEDGAIIAYDNGLVNPNEYSLIPEVEKQIKNWLARYYVQGYMLTDDLYAPTMLGILSTYIPGMIINTRLKYAFTEEAHKFHIDMRFGSRVTYSATRRPIPSEQKMWSSRNFDAIEATMGSSDVLDSIDNKIKDKTPVFYSPIKYMQNSKDSILGTQYLINNMVISDSIILSKLLEIDPTANIHGITTSTNIYNNKKENIDRYRHTGKTTLINAAINEQLTPFYSWNSYVVGQWGSYITSGRLTGVVTIPYKETYVLSHMTTYLLFWYLFKKVTKVDVENIPHIFNPWRVKYPKPHTDLLDGRISQPLAELVIEYTNRIYPQENFVSSTLFVEHIKEQYVATNSLIELAKTSGTEEQCSIYAYLGQVYQNEILNLSTEYNNYTHFFDIVNTNLKWAQALTRDDAVELMNNILTNVLGISVNNNIGVLNDLYTMVLPSTYITTSIDSMVDMANQQLRIINSFNTTINQIEDFYDTSISIDNWTVPDSGLEASIAQIKSKYPNKTTIPSIY